MLKYSIAPLMSPKQRLLAMKGAKKGSENKEEGKENKEEGKEEKEEGKEEKEGEEKEGDKKGAKKTGVEALEPEDIIILVPLRGVQKKRIQYPQGSSVKIKNG